jgi:hypothetical protein
MQDDPNVVVPATEPEVEIAMPDADAPAVSEETVEKEMADEDVTIENPN